MKECIVCKKIIKRTRKDGRFISEKQYSNMKYCSNICHIKSRDKNSYRRLRDGSWFIIDNQGNKSRVDHDSIEKLKEYFWSKNKRGYFISYSKRNSRKKSTLLHRFILNAKNKMVVDHKNRDKLDNRKCNLREVTQRENIINSNYFKSNTGLRGIYYIKRDKLYRVEIQNKGKRYTKTLKTLGEAQKYREKLEKLFGWNTIKMI